MKLCIDCQHFTRVNGRCTETPTHVSPVTGLPEWPFAEGRRKSFVYSNIPTCGPQAFLFKPKLSLWERLKGLFR